MKAILLTCLILKSTFSFGFNIADTCGYFPAPHAEPGNDFCENGQFYDIAALPTSGGELFWYLDEDYTNLVGVGSFCTPLNIIGTTTYYVVAVDNGCISEPSTVNVIVYPAPDLFVTSSSPVSINSGDTVILTAFSGGTVTWNDSIYSNSVIFSKPGTYTVSATNEWGCVTQDTVIVKIKEENVGMDTLTLAQDSIGYFIYVPNCFTPNNDGVNDFFMPITPELDYYSIYIYNRWGKLVFHSNNRNEAWEGGENYLGTSETYTYQISARKKNQLFERTGNITLVR